MNKPRITAAILICIYCFCLILIGRYAYKRPLYNWDMLGYSALVIQKTYKDVNEIHGKTYETIKEDIPEANYTLQVAGTERRKKWATQPNEFYQILPFYAVKPLYIEILNLFYKQGFSLPISTVLPSIISFLLIGALLFYWLVKNLKISWAFATSLLIMSSGPVLSLARLSTPDSLSTFLLLFSFYFIIERPSLRWTFLLMALSLFARLDNIIPCICILSFLFFSGKWYKKVKPLPYITMMSFLIIIYFGITITTLAPFGWSPLYYPTFMRYVNLSGTEQLHFSLAGYLSLLYSQVITALLYFNFSIFLLFLLLTLYPSGFQFRKFSFNQQFALLLAAVIFLKFILFPDLSDRFNMAYYLALIILFIKQYQTLLSSKSNNLKLEL